MLVVCVCVGIDSYTGDDAMMTHCPLAEWLDERCDLILVDGSWPYEYTSALAAAREPD